MERQLERCCGLDVHKETIAACVRIGGQSGRAAQHVQTFRTTAAELLVLRDWLAAHGVTHVAMESTGVYWKPVFYALESDFTCLLVNAAHIKQVPGRKTDVHDCVWIAQLLEHGLLRASFVPPVPIRELRDLTRYRKALIQDRTRVANRLHKALEDGGIKLATVANDILGVSGRAMLEALAQGTTDPTMLAELARGRLRGKLSALRRRSRAASTEEGVMTDRRRFLAKASGAAAAVAAATIIDAPNVIAQPKIQWRMSTTWTPALDVLQGAAQRLAKDVEETSGGRFRIEVFPGGQIMKPFDCFDATSQRRIEAFMGAPYYWTEKEPAFEWFSTVPFGVNCEGMAAWYYQGDGLRLWEEAYAPYNLVPRPGPGIPPQMAGWFRKKINTIGDYKGLKMRIPGLGGKVVAKAGGTAVLTPGADIYASLERGVIDAAEWIGPHDDMKLGLHNAACYYYYPGWHEPGTLVEFTFNKKAYEALPIDLRRMLDQAAAAVHIYGLTDYRIKNAIALERLKTEFKGKVEMLQLPVPVLRDLKKLAIEVVREQSEKTPIARKVHASFMKLQALVSPWDHIAESAYHQFVAM